MNLSPEQTIQLSATIETLRGFMSPRQLKTMVVNIRGEEGQFFYDKLLEMAGIVKATAKTYEQDGKGEDAIVHLHYFRGGMDWFITEKDIEEDTQLQAFGLADLGYGGELGYISIIELLENDIELDIYFTPKTLREVKAERGDT